MPARDVVIPNRQGLHMRPAAELVKLAGSFQADVRVGVGAKTADGKSVMQVLELAGDAVQGATMHLEVQGPEAEACLGALVALVEAGFNED